MLLSSRFDLTGFTINLQKLENATIQVQVNFLINYAKIIQQYILFRMYHICFVYIISWKCSITSTYQKEHRDYRSEFLRPRTLGNLLHREHSQHVLDSKSSAINIRSI